MDLIPTIGILDKLVPDSSSGLPEPLFQYVSRTTPLVNVDLLIKDELDRTLLAWRDDEYNGSGWHLPGGIVRFKETLETRVKKVAENEIGVKIGFEKVPMAVNQFIHPEREIRSHFISLLYKCFLSGTFVPQNKGLFPGDRGYLSWHDSCPDNLIKAHEIYRKFIFEPKT